jgi:hypothetical protein
MWWGSEPAHLKGLLDRVLLPGLTFAYHDDDNWWDKLMEGRSADVIATMDTPTAVLAVDVWQCADQEVETSGSGFLWIQASAFSRPQTRKAWRSGQAFAEMAQTN